MLSGSSGQIPRGPANNRFDTGRYLLGMAPFSGLRHAVRMGASVGPTPPTLNINMKDVAIKAIKLSALVFAGAGLTLASLPLLVSTQPGLDALLSIINNRIPGELRASKAEFVLGGWQRAAVRLHGLELHELPAAGGQSLLTARLIECGGSAWQLIRGQPTQFDISGALLNGGYSASAREFRFIRFLEDAGVLDAPPKEETGPSLSEAVLSTLFLPEEEEKKGIEQGKAPEGDWSNHASDGSSSSPGGAAAAEGDVPPMGAFMKALCDVDDSVGLSGQLRRPDLTVVVRDSRLKVSSDMRDILGGDLHVLGAVGQKHLQWLHGEDRWSHDVAQVFDGIDAQTPVPVIVPGTQSGAQGPPEAAPAAAAAQGPGETNGAPRLRSPSLGVPGSQGDGQGSQGTIPAAGNSQGLAPYATEQRTARSSVAGSGSMDAGRSPRAAPWWTEEPVHDVARARLRAARDEWGEGNCVPGEWQILAPHLDMRMHLWEAQPPPRRWGSDPPSSVTLLHAPASVALRFSQGLSRFGLATVNPLLGRVTSLSEGMQGAMRCTWVPDGMALPYASASLWVEPMCLTLGATPLFTQLIQGLGMTGVLPSWLTRVARAARDKPSPDQGSGQPSPDSDSGSGQGEGSQLLEAWLSGQHVRFERKGIIQQCRVDMLIGPAGLQRDLEGGGSRARRARAAAVHLVLWGQANPDADQIDMVVGLPEDLLSRMGAHGLPTHYCLPLRLHGDMDAPQLQLAGVSRRVAQLLFRHAAQAPTLRESIKGESEQQPEPTPSEAGGEAEQAGPKKRGLLGNVLHVAKVVVSTALHVFSSSEESLALIEQRIEEDTQRVPLQECQVPWETA